MAESKLISIILPAFKVENYIEECLQSIQSQTFFANNSNYEILVGVDNDLTTLQKLKTIQTKIKNLKVYNSDRNVGAYILRNSLVKRSTGDYILFFDADDVLKNTAVEEIMCLPNKDYVRFHYQNFEVDSNNIKNLQAKTVQAMGVFFISRKTFNRVGGFQPWFCAADQEFQTRALHNNINSVDMNSVLMLRRVHPNQLTKDSLSGMQSELRKSYHEWIKTNKNWRIPISPITMGIDLVYQDEKAENSIKHYSDITYLQIWMGSEPNPQMKKWMSDVESLGNYVLITDNPTKPNHIDINEYVKKMCEDPILDAFYKKMLVGLPGNSARSNLIRIHYLASNENTLYVDTDVSFISKPKLNQNFVYLCKTFRDEGAIMDFFLMYNGTHLKFFKDLMYKSINNFNAKGKTNVGRGWLWGALWDHTKKHIDTIRFFNPTTVEHFENHKSHVVRNKPLKRLPTLFSIGIV